MASLNYDLEAIAFALEVFAGIDAGENTNTEELLRLASVARSLKDAARLEP